MRDPNPNSETTVRHMVISFCYILCVIDESVSQMERQVHINHPSNWHQYTILWPNPKNFYQDKINQIFTQTNLLKSLNMHLHHKILQETTLSPR